MAAYSTAMVVWEPPVEVPPTPMVEFQRGDKVIVSHKDPSFNGAIGQVEKYMQHMSKYVVRIPSGKCSSLCKRSSDCVKACVDGRHKGWCKTDLKRMSKGVGVVLLLSSNLEMASELDLFSPVVTEIEDDAASSNGCDKSSDASSATAYPNPDAEAHTSNKRKEPASDENMDKEKLSKLLHDYMIYDLGLKEEFAQASAKAVAEEAIDGKHFQPVMMKRYRFQ